MGGFIFQQLNGRCMHYGNRFWVRSNRHRPTDSFIHHTDIPQRIGELTSGSAMAEGLRDALVSRNSATTKYPYRLALFA